MGKLKKNVKKGIVLALSAVMALGLTPSVLNGSQKVQAADAEEQAPTAIPGFATKDELLAGDSSQRLKLYLGVNSKGNYQSWYVLGKDDSVSGENTVLFSEVPLAYANSFGGEYPFSTTLEDKNLSGVDVTYTDGSTPATAYASHYAASDARKSLQTLASGDKVFTAAEKSVLNKTTVSTKDLKNDGKTYTTTDTLYLPQMYYNGGVNKNNIYLGTKDDKTFYIETTDDSFWGRSATSNKSGTVASMFSSNGYVTQFRVTDYFSLRPATNVNLDQVLFAAAGTTPQNNGYNQRIYNTDTPMSLRYDGSNQNLGTISYNSVTKTVDLSQNNAKFYCVLGTNTNGELDMIRTFSYKSTVADISRFDFTKPIKIWAETGTDGKTLNYATNPDDTVDTAKKYKIEQGNGGTWTENTDTTYTFKADGDLDKFTGVSVDGNLVSEDNYTKKAGSTILTFNEAYLKTLSDGEHTVSMAYSDGYPATATFTVKKDNSSAGGNTGGNENPGENPGDNNGGNGGQTENPYEKPEVVTPSGDTITKGETTDYPVVKPDDDKKLPTVDKVRVDGKELEKDKDYTVDGDGNVTIKKDYIDSLPVGDHTIEIAGKDANGQDDTIKKDLTVANPANGGETWTPASDKDYVVTPDNKLADVSGVKINGNWIDPKDYTIASDGTLTLKKDYLATLPNGDYAIEIIGKDANGNDAVAKATFSVAGSSVTKDPVVTPTNPTTDQTGTTTPAAKTPTQTASPKTGENFGSPLMLVWAGSLILALGMLASMLADGVKSRRRR